MSAFRTRIRAVRFKSGGEIRLLPSLREETGRDVAAWLRRETDSALACHGDSLAGAALVVWTADGDCGAAVRNTTASPLAHSAVPSTCAEAIRKVFVLDLIERSLGHDEDEVS